MRPDSLLCITVVHGPATCKCSITYVRKVALIVHQSVMVTFVATGVTQLKQCHCQNQYEHQGGSKLFAYFGSFVLLLTADKEASFHSIPSAWLPLLVAINLWVWAFFNFIFIARVGSGCMYFQASYTLNKSSVRSLMLCQVTTLVFYL